MICKENLQTGQVVYTPPQHPDEIEQLMDNLERYMNDDSAPDIDPLTGY